MDHVLTSDSLTPSPGISKAVLDMPQPENKAATCRFLGTIMYLSKFCPHLSRVVHPRRDLTHLKQHHLGRPTHKGISGSPAEAAVKSAKRILLTADDVDLALLSVRDTPPAGHTILRLSVCFDVYSTTTSLKQLILLNLLLHQEIQ